MVAEAKRIPKSRVGAIHESPLRIARATIGGLFTLQRGTTYKSLLLDQPGPVLLGLGTINRNGGFRRDSLRTYGGESPEQLLVYPGELYVSLKDVTQSADLLGAIAQLPLDHAPGRLTQDTVKLIPRGPNIPLDYIHWLLRTPQYRSYCRAHATGTTNLGLPRDDFLAFEVPEYTPARHNLVHLLGTLDDKIELNRRMNETLEEMARALFKSWFVDFDPVHAKAEGREPSGMDAETAKLFPSEFEMTEHGRVPKGWRSAPLKAWVSVLSGGTPSKSNPALWNGTLPWISPKVMTAIHADEADAFVTEAAVGKGTRIAPSGSTLVMVRGMGLHQHVRVSQARRDVTFNQDVKALVPVNIQPDLLLFAMLDAQQELLLRVETSGHGTGRLASDILLGQQVVMPRSEIQTAMSDIFESLNSRIELLRAESRSLADIRDTILPRLLSGELSVRDAERALVSSA